MSVRKKINDIISIVGKLFRRGDKVNTYPEPYIDYLTCFHAERDFFECHEILEEYWKKHRRSELSQAWLGLIQVAVSLYHQRRGNLAGARKMMKNAIANLCENDLKALGIAAVSFLDLLADRYRMLMESPLTPYEDLNIPIADDALLKLCLKECKRRGILWNQPSDLTNEYIMLKHTMRDRSDVIEFRLQEKERRRRERKDK